MNSSPIIFGKPSFDHREQELVASVIATGWIGQGPLVERFEAALGEYVEASHVVSVSSCTTALELSLRALGIGPGDEVITTPMTFIATANAIESVGAEVKLCDVDEDSLLLEPDAVRGAITPRTRAIMPVSFGGRPLDAVGYAQLLDDHPALWVVEDAAHSVGGIAAGTPVGGDRHPRWVACFSFYPNKNLGSAEGGAVTTADSNVVELIRSIRLHGLDVDAWQRYRTDRFEPSLAVRPGMKANWTDLQAAIALPQLDKLEGFLATREWVASALDEALSSVQGIDLVRRGRPSLRHRHALHLYQVRVDAGIRNRVVESLRAKGIGAAVHYIGVNLHPRFSDAAFTNLPVSDRLSSELISLPLHPGISAGDCLRMADALGSSVAEAAEAEDR